MFELGEAKLDPLLAVSKANMMDQSKHGVSSNLNGQLCSLFSSIVFLSDFTCKKETEDIESWLLGVLLGKVAMLFDVLFRDPNKLT